MGFLGSNRTISRLNDGSKKKQRISIAGMVQATMLISLALFAIVNLMWLGNLDVEAEDVDKEEHLIRASRHARTLRLYPPHRYYKLDMPRNDQPEFLTKADYIYGEWPVILHSDVTRKRQLGPSKLSVDQSDWLTIPNATVSGKMPRRSHVAGEIIGSLPFADGTNPSILTMDRIEKRAPEQAKLLKQHYPSAHFIATACMTTSQCAWKDSLKDIADFHVSTQSKPDTVRTVVLVLDRDHRSIAQATLYLEHDARWGRKYRKPAPEGDAEGPVTLKMPAFDDARLFVHAGQVYVSFREGKGFGYETQVLNPIHFHFSFQKDSTAIQMEAHTRASESSTLCCGRNMALMTGKDENQLKAVTWVDPIATVSVDTTPGAQNKPPAARQLAKREKSHIHGTNAFMVDLPNKVFLGMAHFHRPNDRKANPYARFGHHYTHAFFSIQNDKLVGLSAEFVFRSAYHTEDAEIIQFASGLEYDELRQQIVIAYGINDCEAAVTAIALETIEGMLRPVESGKEVLDYMKPLGGSE